MYCRCMFCLLALILMLLSMLTGGCSGDATPVSTPPTSGPAPPAVDGILPSLADLPDNVPVKSLSATHPVPVENCGATANAVIDGSTVRLASGETELSAAWWSARFTKDSRNIPYLAPYSMTFTTDNGGPFWVAIPNYSTGRWNILHDQYSGASVTIPVGLDKHAAKLDGTFWWVLITYGGDEVTVTGIDLEYPEPGFTGEPVEYHQYIAAGDGTQLATFAYLPLEALLPVVPDPPYPVVLMRTPYDVNNVVRPAGPGTPLWEPIQNLADGNVLFMIQYFRGRLNDSGAWPDSEGTETMFRDHAGPSFHDAIDTVAWIEARNFYNNDLVLAGPSALGLWIYQAATVLGDRVKGIYPQVSSGNVAHWAALRNGCFKRSNVEGWLTGNSYPPALLDEAVANFGNQAYWDELDFDAQASGTNCPGYHETGWWDVDVESTINSWQQLNTSGDSLAAGHQYLIIGPWNHETVRGNVIGELTFPTTVTHDPRTLPNSWDGIYWIAHLLGRDPFFATPSSNVFYYFIGEEGNDSAPNNTWYVAPDWPPVYAEEEMYVIDDPAFGLFTIEPAPGTMNWQCDPAFPVATIGGANLPIPTVVDAGPYNQGLTLLHPHVMVLNSGTLIERKPIAGPVKVELHVATDAADTDIMVKLIDKYPDDKYMLVADSAVRLSWYLETYTIWSEVTPGQIYQVNLEIGQRAYNFESGHEIVLIIQSTNYPRFDINPGNGDAFYDETNGQLQTNTLHYGTGNLSKLILPVFDPDA